jgi:hypothetical protein
LLALACSNPTITATARGGDVSALSPEIEAWLPWAALDMDAVLTRLGGSPSDVAEGRAYGPTSGLSVVHVPAKSPAHFYFQGSELALIYFGSDAVEGLVPGALAAEYSPTLALRSRVGKKHSHHVAAQAGLAWSADKGEVALIELFAPQPAESWQALWYEEPPPFRK